ncbi:MbcA/ParS/Xre antitoxin family protein [Stenotrophomonas geniculata]|uniref:MbcA/ParS/Xre antitoxin family protein n=1 Tax=Stenotrophomonas geniculata TaxID=86188 RepID=UPI00287F4C73|nr:MbcA/ParS/Xre antitoxin family protein [Stenotrophomonas geniculata]EKT4071996.1 DUF2384 domain-containing protein [Stenotrophomonas maltophilia]EKT4080522.1 DUF2384 domain-containing protein [Stenotrophomonas maltophilia]WNF10292.1 MbcA/ParS/Xre antitoxin family protein [Stenotrophomonas geniculata]
MSSHFSGHDACLAAPALRIFTNIARAWSLTDWEQSEILGQPVSDAFALLTTGVVDDRWPETLERLSYVIGIYAALHTVFRDQQQADGWIRRPNQAPLFGGAPALSLMRCGRIEGLASVRKYLEHRDFYDDC